MTNTDTAQGLSPLERLQRPGERRSTESKATMRPLSFTIGGETVNLRVLPIRQGEAVKTYAGAKLTELLSVRTDNGEQMVSLAHRLLTQSAEEMIDLVLRYDVDEVMPRIVDDEAGLLRSDWVEERATLEEVETAFLEVLAVLFPFVRRVRQLAQGANWGQLLSALQGALASSKRPSATSQTPTR